MPNTAPAYAPHAQAAPPLHVVRGGRYRLRRAQRAAQKLFLAAAAALMLAMIVAVVYSQAQVTRISGQIEKTRAELTNAQSTYDYLSDTMSNITSNTNVQQVAEGRLGLVRADASQVTYIKLQEQSVIEKSNDGLERMLEGLGTAALSLIHSLDP